MTAAPAPPPQPLPPLPARPTVAVIVPAFRAAGPLPAAVASARSQPDVNEVVVAAGDPDTRTVADRLAAQDARVRVVDNPTGRTPDALNAAVAATDAEVVVRLDAHAVLPAGYVARALETLRATGAANVGGRQVPVADGGFARAVAAAMASPAGAGGAAYRVGGDPGPVDTVYLGVFRREALETVGGFDPRFTRNQDAELNLRLRRAGYTVWFDPQLAVDYRPRASVRALASQYFQYGRWRRLTARVHSGSLRPRQLAPPVLVIGLAAAVTASAATRSAAPAAVVAGTYAAGLLAAGIHAAPDLRTAPGTAVALGTMHLAWGIGFLAGPPRQAPHHRPVAGHRVDPGPRS